MALTLFDKDLDIIAKLADEPNDVGGLGADQFKAEFDKAGNIIKDYINKTLIPEVESDIDKAAQGIGTGGGINGESILDDSIPDTKIKSVNGNKIADSTINGTKLAKATIPREKLAEDAIMLQTEDFPNKVVPNRALADKCVDEYKLADGAVTKAKMASETRTQYYILNVSTSWTGSAAPFTQTITENGIKAEDLPKIFFYAPSSFAAAEAQQEAFGMLYDVESADGSITLYAKEKPSVAFNVLCEVIRI